MIISQLTQAFKAANAGLTIIDYFKIRLESELAGKRAQAPLVDSYSEFQQDIAAILSAITKSVTKDIVAPGFLKRINASVGNAEVFLSQLRTAPTDARMINAHIRICNALRAECSKIFKELM